MISANQLSVFGAAANLCKEPSEDPESSEKPEASDHLETMDVPPGPSLVGTHTNAQQRCNLVQDHEQKFKQLSDDQKLSKLCSLVERG